MSQPVDLEDLSTPSARGRLFEMFEQGPVVLFEWSAAEGWPIRYVSPNVTRELGLDHQALITGRQVFAEAIHPDDLERVHQEVASYLSTGTVDFVQRYRIIDQQGQVRWVRDYTHVIYDTSGAPETILGFVLDNTAEEQARQALEEEKSRNAWNALHDPLTGLYNRRYLHQTLQCWLQALREPAQTRWNVLFFIDLDNFKDVNDLYGHTLGDRLLREWVARVRSLLPEETVFVRFGGDEFILLKACEGQSQETSTRLAEQMARQLIDVTEQPFEIDQRRLSIGASIGIVVFNGREGWDEEALIRYGDSSMFVAKRVGRNRYQVFTEPLQRQEEQRARRLALLREAIGRGELWLAWQPKVHLRSDGSLEAAGAEALVRWNSPELGQVSPAAFIPLAEEGRLIESIGDWVLAEAIRQRGDWARRQVVPESFVISINVSSMQFYQADFVERVTALCSAQGVLPGQIRLELTESVLLDNAERGRAQLEALSRAGFTTSLDDFGTGYSSLSYLKTQRFDELKVDRSFVRELESSESDRVLTRVIMDLARHFRLEVVAEGVEDAGTVALLAEMGCATFQGFHFSPPLDAPAFERWLAAFGRDPEGATTAG